MGGQGGSIGQAIDGGDRLIGQRGLFSDSPRSALERACFNLGDVVATQA